MDSLKTSFEDLLSLPLLSADILSSHSVANVSGRMHEWFWSSSFWLPDGVTWSDVAPGNNAKYPDSSDIATYPILIGIFFLFLKRLVIGPFILSPLAKSFGLRDKKKSQPESIADLKILYQNFGSNVPPKMLMMTSRRLNWSTRQVEQWLRKKEISQKHTVYEKFIHVGFAACFEVFFLIFGIVVLYDKPFIWNAALCFEGFPFHEISPEVWYYYMIGLGYFWCLAMSLILENYSKEYVIDSIHHVVTILLMSLSWVNNFVRIGCLVLLLHNFSDAIFFPGKMILYAKHKRIADVFFALFVVVWTVSRIVLFPLHVIYNVLRAGFLSKSLFVFDVLLICLFILHVRWTVLIYKVLFQKIRKGDIVDMRSSDEQSNDNESPSANEARGESRFS